MDGLRAFAALSVVAFHVDGQTGAYHSTTWGSALLRGNIGVTVFFVISGLLLYRPFVEARLGGLPTRSLGAYLTSRALRLLPAYWTALLILGLGPLHTYVFSSDWWRYAFLLQVYDERTMFGAISVAWTLCVEASFYLLLPALAWAIGRIVTRVSPSQRVGVELALLAALGAASLLSRLVDGWGPGSVWSQSLPGTMHWFVLGMLLAVISTAVEAGALERWQRLGGRPVLAWAAAGVLLIPVFALTAGDGGNVGDYSLGGQLAYGLFALALVWPAAWPGSADSRIGRVLAHPLAAWLGLISYGIYLWHVNVITELDPYVVRIDGDGGVGVHYALLALLAIGGAILVAALSYYVVERPSLRRKPRRPGASPHTA
jgi:peptidoglycan/LPS O-acetylase OafA/YrhL